jgi:protocatechuate 3,4-dioxygenase, beta subunit
MNIWRRKFNQFMFTLPTLPALTALVSPRLSKAQGSTTFASKRLPTPQDGEGPFYPKQWSGELDSDLLNFNGKQYSNGTPMTLAGKVYSVDGTPLAGATIEVWQCDEIGEYRHPSSGGEAPAERGFQGFSRILSTSEGGYSFRTLKPVPYNGRPAHVHFRVMAAGHRPLTTQMYFNGENEEGNFLLKLYGFLGGFSRERDRLTASPESRRIDGKTELLTLFDITLEKIS